MSSYPTAIFDLNTALTASTTRGMKTGSFPFQVLIRKDGWVGRAEYGLQATEAL